jgi:hypothetical protein
VPRDLKLKYKNAKTTVINALHEIGAEQPSRNTKPDERPKYRLWIIRDIEKWRESGAQRPH